MYDVPQPQNFCSGISSLSLVNFLQCNILQIHDRLSEQFSDSQAAFGTTFFESQAALGKPKKLLEEGIFAELRLFFCFQDL
jgi:hypothetical protein